MRKNVQFPQQSPHQGSLAATDLNLEVEAGHGQSASFDCRLCG
jgi:hypothetical protein